MAQIREIFMSRIFHVLQYTEDHLTLTSNFDLDPWPQNRLKDNKTRWQNMFHSDK